MPTVPWTTRGSVPPVTVIPNGTDPAGSFAPPGGEKTMRALAVAPAGTSRVAGTIQAQPAAGPVTCRWTSRSEAPELDT